jgi:Trk K+ transport system NAD-binding subunit
MSDALFLILRRLRAPLIALIVVYAISVGGLALMPGVAPDGTPQRMSIFHAFYVISYTATTIGFGELPSPFTDAQRLWVTFAIYLSVIGWAYTLGTVVALANDAPFRTMLARSIFNWRARGIAEPFYILCGYGQSGARLARALDRLGNRLVIVEPNTARSARIAIQDYATPPLTLAADARLPDVLEDCGIRKPECLGLIALAGEDGVNQAIAIGARVLSPSIPIVAQAKSDVARVNLESFGGVVVINPFETFAFNLGVALRAPEIVQIEDWLTATPGSPCPVRTRPPRGRWMLVGYGRFGRAIGKVLDGEGIEWRAFDPGIAETSSDPHLLHGEYTERTLNEGGIATADVVVAGTDSDSVNLGVATLARRARPDIFVVIRQNHMQDRALVEAAHADLKFVQSELMVNECLQVLKTPMLGRFIAELRAADSAVALATLERVQREVGEGAPRAWTFDCDVLQPGMFYAFFQRAGSPFKLARLVADPTNPSERLRAAALMLERGSKRIVLPEEETLLKPGDRILFVGDDIARRLQQRYLTEVGTIAWVCSGTEPTRGLVFRWWEKLSRDKSEAPTL